MNQYISKAEEIVITRWSDAKSSGSKYYFTGVPCKHGHISKRDVSDRSCYKCKLIKSAKWKHQNPDKHAKANLQWGKNNKESRNATQARQRARDPKMYWARSVFQNARKRSQVKCIPFDLTVEYIYNLPEQSCPVFGTTFEFVGNGKIRPESPSLDRIVPEKGYVNGNVVIISAKANTIKQNANSDEIFKVARWLQEQGN